MSSSHSLASNPRQEAAPEGARRGLIDRSGMVLVGVLFFVSGIPALVNQMVWQRILAIHSGVGIYSVAMIVAAYMAGLGIGSLAGGLASRRLGMRSALFAFAAVELSVGLFAAISCRLYYDVLFMHGAWFAQTTWRAGVGHFLVLLPPTCLMGMTLPLLVRAMVREVKTAPRTVGILYGVNTLGAGVGALITPWILIRQLGLANAVLVGVGCNIMVGVGALIIGLARDGASRDPASEESPATVGPGPDLDLDAADRQPFVKWVVLYALGGFLAMALELIWFRLTDVGVKSTAFTFGTVLAVNLLGLGAGTLLGAGWAGRVREPFKAFLACQCLILITAGLAVLLLVHLPVDLPGYREFIAYCNGYEGLVPSKQNLPALLVLYGGLPVLLFGVPTLLMGLSFTFLQRAVQDDRRTSGFKVGVLQCANIVGCVAGSLLVGLVLFSALGTAGTLRAMVVSACVFAVLGGLQYGPRSSFAPLGLALVVLAWALPDGEALWLRLHGLTAGPALFGEDATGVVAMTPEPDGRWRMSVNGKGQSWLPFSGLHSSLGALPATLHPAPRRVAIIGLGTGDTAWAAACRPETEKMTVFEISAPQLQLLHRLGDSGPFSQLGPFLSDPRVDQVVADGRHALATDRQTYDLIEADAIRPSSAYSGNLYSLEFFRICASKLNPGGLMCTWSPTERVRETFLRAFAHVLEIERGIILVGSNDPIHVDPAAWEGRLRQEKVADYLGPAVVAECSKSLLTARPLPTSPDAHDPAAINHDLFPKDEFSSRR